MSIKRKGILLTGKKERKIIEELGSEKKKKMKLYITSFFV